MLDMADEVRSQSNDGAGGLFTQHGLEQIFQRGGEGGTTIRRSSDGPVGSSRGRRAEEPHIPAGKNMMANYTIYGEITSRGGGGVCDSQRGCRGDTETNAVASILDLPGYMAVGG